MPPKSSRLAGVLLVTSSLVLTGCTTAGPKQQSGALMGGLGGAAAGAVIGSAIGGRDGALVGAAIGGLGGALIGGEIGRQMDERDRAARNAAMRAAFAEQARNKTGHVRRAWTNPTTGNRGEFVALRTYTQDGKSCAVFKESYHKHEGGQTFSEEHTRCAGADGFY